MVEYMSSCPHFGDRRCYGGRGKGPLGTVLLASSSWFKKRRRGVEKAKDVVTTGEGESVIKLTCLIALNNERNEMKQFSRYWCFFGLELELVVSVCMTCFSLDFCISRLLVKRSSTSR